MEDRIYQLVDMLIEQLEKDEYYPVSKKISLRSKIVQCITDEIRNNYPHRTIYLVPKAEVNAPPKNENTVVIGYDNHGEIVDLFRAALRMQPEAIKFYYHHFKE